MLQMKLICVPVVQDRFKIQESKAPVKAIAIASDVTEHRHMFITILYLLLDVCVKFELVALLQHWKGDINRFEEIIRFKVIYL